MDAGAPSAGPRISSGASARPIGACANRFRPGMDLQCNLIEIVRTLNHTDMLRHNPCFAITADPLEGPSWMSSPSSAHAAAYRGPETMSLEDFPIPDIGEDDLLLEVILCGVDGSELAMYRGAFDYV